MKIFSKKLVAISLGIISALPSLTVFGQKCERCHQREAGEGQYCESCLDRFMGCEHPGCTYKLNLVEQSANYEADSSVPDLLCREHWLMVSRLCRKCKQNPVVEGDSKKWCQQCLDPNGPNCQLCGKQPKLEGSQYCAECGPWRNSH